ncbi:putative 3 exoribonuclease family protein [Rosellinia necatrix]|uniref:Ribosomal RNA-processing protein 42 n=1 Tax=Rosellinia necatrix TaxID=77044 RepID=A0A1W2TL33_ROSNE|nr:putative 3 exoribonuclease family protein [Rosellinia necatrix]
MATTSQHLLLSPAELAYLHSTLSLTPPIRPDGRTATQFRPLTAETGILPGTNGSARVCFADGTEAVVGVKAEVEKTATITTTTTATATATATTNVSSILDEDAASRRRRRKGKSQETTEGDAEDGDGDGDGDARRGERDWVELSVEIPGARDDDSGTVFLSTMLAEALLADGELAARLWINRRFHWKLYLDVILISPPLSYPLPLLSLTAHLALLATRLPRLRSEGDEDPMFDDDWAASRFLYPRNRTTTTSTTTTTKNTKKTTTKTTAAAAAAAAAAEEKAEGRGGSSSRPPITLLVMAAGDNVIFDPSKEELAVADCALAVSVGEAPAAGNDDDDLVTTGTGTGMDVDGDDVGVGGAPRTLRLLSVRTIDPPSRLTAPGVPNAVNAAAWGQGGSAATSTAAATPASVAKENGGGGGGGGGAAPAETGAVDGVWRAPRGGPRIAVIGAMVEKVLRKGGVADEVFEGLDGVEIA